MKRLFVTKERREREKVEFRKRERIVRRERDNRERILERDREIER